MKVMQKAVWTAALAAAVFLVSNPVFAQQTDTASVTVTVHVNAKAKLTIDSASVDFADADPTTFPTISATPLNISVKARTSTAGVVVLDAKAPDLTSGSDTITIGNITWTATGSGFNAGTMATTDSQVGTWTGSGNQSGTQTLVLANSWTYNTGTYGSTITYTLTAP